MELKGKGAEVAGVPPAGFGAAPQFLTPYGTHSKPGIPRECWVKAYLTGISTNRLYTSSFMKGSRSLSSALSS